MIIGYCSEVSILLVFSVGKTPPEGSSILMVSHHCTFSVVSQSYVRTCARAGPAPAVGGRGLGTSGVSYIASSSL